MSVKRCPKCGSVWYSELPNCAFCGVEGEQQNMPILTGKVHGESRAEAKAKAPAPEPAPAPVPEESPVAVAEATPIPPPPSDPPAEVKGEPVTEVKLDDTPPPEPRVEPPPPKVEARPKPPPAPVLPPAPRIPSATLPVVFAALGFVAFLIVPAAVYLHTDRVGGILTLLAYGVLAPFAPLAWLRARRYEERCRAMGFEPAWAGRTGRVVGCVATFMVVAEAALVAIALAVLHLAGKLPNLFGA